MLKRSKSCREFCKLWGCKVRSKIWFYVNGGHIWDHGAPFYCNLYDLKLHTVKIHYVFLPLVKNLEKLPWNSKDMASLIWYRFSKSLTQKGARGKVLVNLNDLCFYTVIANNLVYICAKKIEKLPRTFQVRRLWILAHIEQMYFCTLLWTHFYALFCGNFSIFLA